MKAKLWKERVTKNGFDIYVLIKDDGKCDFYNELQVLSKGSTSAVFKGFLKFFDEIISCGFIHLIKGDHGHWKDWFEPNIKIKGINEHPLLSELRKGDYRIMFFEYAGGKILLCNLFKKKGDKAKKEYKKAYNMKVGFDKDPKWED